MKVLAPIDPKLAQMFRAIMHDLVEEMGTAVDQVAQVSPN